MSKARFRLRPWIVVVLAVAAVLAVVAPLYVWNRGAITLRGLAENDLLSRAELERLTVTVTTTEVDPKSLRARVGDRSVPLERQGAGYVVRLRDLTDGRHELVVSGGRTEVTRRFTVDTTAPELRLRPPDGPAKLNRAVTVTGTVEEGATVRAEAGQVTRDGTALRIRYAQPPTDAAVVVTDRAGNTATQKVTVPTRYPDAVRGVHLSGYAWSSPGNRNSALRLVRERRINAVQIDIKEEDGIVNMAVDVPLANRIGAVVKKYDAAEMTRTLHAMGVRVIGRVVVFYDPVLARWAWQHGRRDWVVQSAGGGPYASNYGHTAFTNLASAAVRQYNIDIAKAAVRAGVDDIVFDYIRRPEGRFTAMRFPGLRGAPERAIADFCKEARRQLRPMGAYVGAALFAQAVRAPQDTAQNVRMMAEHLDVVVPMDYPNHWAPGEYGVPNPATQPGPIVQRSLADWAKAVAGTGCVVVPWLWASDVLGPYSPAMVAAQIHGARANRMPGWLMWNALAHYDKWAPAFSPDAAPVR
ncbi:MAG TPA: putative glycoside hydrolase [Cryptosporangiaceae bacterium]|nr:putative glycoside hydrolase [Cryptosporangiaceae bacterium]